MQMSLRVDIDPDEFPQEVERELSPKHQHWQEIYERSYQVHHPYLEGRGVTWGQIVKFKIRCTNESVLIPIFKYNRDIVGVVERPFKPEPGQSKYKYYMSGRKPLVWPEFEADLFGLQQTVFVEGIFGALALRKHGILAFAIYSAGQNHKAITEKYKATVPHKAHTPVVWFDQDTAGINGGEQLAKMLNANILFAEVDVQTRESAYRNLELSVPIIEALSDPNYNKFKEGINE